MANTLPLKPIGGKILVQPKPEETTTASGLVISSTAKGEKPQQGTVVALGSGKRDKDGKALEWEVKVGDEVLFKKYSPDEVELGSDKYLIMEESDILAVLN